MYFLNNDTGWVAGTNGLIMKTIDAGANWTWQNSGTLDEFRHIYFKDANKGFAFGGPTTTPNKIYRTYDGGTTWSLAYTAPTGVIIGVMDMTNDSTAFFTCSNGGTASLFKFNTNTNLASLAYSTSKPGVQYYTGLHFQNSTTGYAVGTTGGPQTSIVRTTNGGLSWSEETGMSNQNLMCVRGEGNTLITVGLFGVILSRSNTTGIASLKDEKNTLRVFPNPAGNSLTIESDLSFTCKIISESGKLIKEVKVTKGKNEINIEDFKAGIYFIQHGTDSIKFMKN
jgi:photosystem II stability/assembly factor-like uncharacterized protein